MSAKRENFLSLRAGMPALRLDALDPVATAASTDTLEIGVRYWRREWNPAGASLKQETPEEEDAEDDDDGDDDDLY